MANIRNSNTFFIDSTSVGGTPASFIAEKNVKVKGVIFTSGGANQSATLNNIDISGPSAGDVKLPLALDVADKTQYLDFSLSPVVFPNGIWVSAISGSMEITVILAPTAT